MAKVKEKFPKHLFVGIENEGTDDQYFLADKSPQGMQVQNDERTVAMYRLEGMVKIRNKTEVV